MYREPAPDEDTRWENWNSVIKEAESLYQRAIDADGERRKYFLQQAMNVLEGVPNAHPEKAALVRKVSYLL